MNNDVNGNLNRVFGVDFVTENLPIAPEKSLIAPETAPERAKNEHDHTKIENNPSQHEKDIESDYESSRETHKGLIDQGTEALDKLLRVADESQNPRAYEVAALLLKNISDMTNKLMTLHEKTKSLQKKNNEGKESASPINVEKGIFVGSTSDLLKKIKQQ